MKNTVKKILALVFVVAMVCSLAVPAFAAEEFTAYNVKLVVVDANGKATSKLVTIESAKKANLLDALKAAETTNLDFSFKNNVLKSAEISGLDFETEDEFETSSLVVALNGKAITTDLSTVAVAKDDVIVVYWADATIGTKLAVVDDSNIASGIVAFYYYDAEGNKQPLVDLAVELTDAAGNKLGNKFVELPKETNAVNETVYAGTVWGTTFVTDENGQIWIAPEYLDNKAGATYTVSIVPLTAEELKELKLDEKASGYTEDQVTYYNQYIEFALVDDALAPVVVEENMYDVAGATGDMTVVYVLVAFVAVATIAAVVVMKKKSVKAN